MTAPRANGGTLRLRVLGALRVDQPQTCNEIRTTLGEQPGRKGRDLVGTVLRRLEREGLVVGHRAVSARGAVGWLLTAAGADHRRELVAALTVWRRRAS